MRQSFEDTVPNSDYSFTNLSDLLIISHIYQFKLVIFAPKSNYIFGITSAKLCSISHEIILTTEALDTPKWRMDCGCRPLWARINKVKITTNLVEIQVLTCTRMVL